MTIGDRIKKILNDKGLNYRSLSKLIPYSDVQIRRICLNESVPKVDFIQHFCNTFPDINIKWLITGIESSEIKSLLTELEVNKLSKLIFENLELFKSNTIFQMIIMNEVKQSRIEQLVKEIQDLEKES